MSGKADQQQKEQQARKRVDLIVQVLSKQITASQAAKSLGVSRKTYYQWEKKFLSGAMGAVLEKKGGRPAREVDEEKVELQRRLSELEKQVKVLKHAVRIRDLLQPREPAPRGRPPKKRKGKRARLKQGQLDLSKRYDDESKGVSGHGPGGDNGLQGHSDAPFSGDEPGKGVDGTNGPFPPGSSGVVDDPLRFDEKTWKKKSGTVDGD
jgi:transposase